MIFEMSPTISASDTIAYMEFPHYAIEKMDNEERRMWLGR